MFSEHAGKTPPRWLSHLESAHGGHVFKIEGDEQRDALAKISSLDIDESTIALCTLLATSSFDGIMGAVAVINSELGEAVGSSLLLGVCPVLESQLRNAALISTVRENHARTNALLSMNRGFQEAAMDPGALIEVSKSGMRGILGAGSVVEIFVCLNGVPPDDLPREF